MDPDGVGWRRGGIVAGIEREPFQDSGTIVLRAQFPLGVDVAPRTPTEHKLEEIWRKALGMGRVGIADPYEDLGGDSLLAAGMLAEIEQTFAIEIPMATLVRCTNDRAVGSDALVSQPMK